MSQNTKIFYYRLIFATIGIFSIVYRIGLTVTAVPEGGSTLFSIFRLFSYFTIQTNILVVSWYLLALAYSKSDKKPFLLGSKIKGALTLYITVTCIVFAALIHAKWNPQGMQLLIACITHYVTPVFFIIDWYMTEERGTYKWYFPVYWVIYPLFYLIYALLFNHFTGVALYHFINLKKLEITSLAFNITGLCLFFILLGFIYTTMNKKLPQKMNSAT